MKNVNKTKEQLIKELGALRQRIAELEASPAEFGRAETKYATNVETALDGFSITDLKGQFIYVNDSYCRMTGHSREELLAMSILDVEAIEKRDETAQHIKRIIEQGYDRFETRHRCKDGRIIELEISAKYSDVEGGQFVILIRDITERKRDEEEIKQSHDRLQKALESIIWATAATVEARDPYTAGHQQRVTNISLVIANEMRLSEEKKQEIRMAGMVHDLGKVCIPAEILSKPGKLNSVEFSMVKMHPQAGHDIFKNVDLPWPIADILLQHHERLDGSGYPRRLKGKDILLAARIIAVADVVEAMASHRPYRPALGIDKALEEISDKRGILYDPDVVDACLSLFKEKGLPIPQLAPDLSEAIAQAIHEGYRHTQRGKAHSRGPSIAQWDKLPHYLKDSNRQQAEHILKKLSRIGCTVHRVTNQDIRLITFTEDEVEIMAEMEHQRWNVERLLDDWVRGKRKDAMKKTNPYLVPSSELPDDVKELDRQMVRKIPELLAKVGLEIHRQSSSKGEITKG